jgi:phosphoglucosamine mutase
VGRLFGTDGVRGLANTDLTAELALGLSSAAVRVLAEAGEARPTVVVGRDTRPSGEFLEGAVVAGLAAAGADVLRMGVVPTPGVAHAVAASGAALGVMLSASHNPMPDNGIKLFARGGHKLPDAVEDDIEAHLGRPWEHPTGAAVGRIRDAEHLRRDYVEHLLGTLPGDLAGLRVVVDCAEGAASDFAPDLLARAGASVIPIHAGGDGLRINDGCGATALRSLQDAVRQHGADAGIAHDGDADRCLAVDATGDVVDGDQILAACAVALHERGSLAGDTVVTTVMANLGFRQAMAAHGITVVATPVGDRYVLEAMRAGGFVLGGEQSGHLVFLEHATTGDGMLTALQLLARVRATGTTLREVASVMSRLPQVLLNVRTGGAGDRAALCSEPSVLAAVERADARLQGNGRVLLRPSGTEPLVRVMVEAPDHSTAETVAREVATAVEQAAAAPRPS